MILSSLPPGKLALALGVAAMLLGSGCTERASFTIGDECDLNSQCASPLVCRIGRCRIECKTDIDCGIGLACYFEPDAGVEESGGCQLDDENECSLDSDCSAGLVCKFGTCTVACLDDRDCAPGSACVEQNGAFACVSTNDSCIYNSDCPEPLICGPEQSCRLECREDRDCVTPRTCDPLTFRCVL